jgi:LDH2 family malate/lactate/ureidoglycolate dehydrogenase
MASTQSGAGELPTVVRPVAVVTRLAEDLMTAAGARREKARIAAEIFIEADLRGIGLQGLDYMPLVVRALASGRIPADAEPTVLEEGASSLLIDGGAGMVQPTAVWAIDRAIPKARDSGCCAIGIVNASENFMLGYYVERIARAGCIGFAAATWAPLVHPHGGMEALLGTNPIAFGFPTADDDPIIVDLATSALANGRIRQAAYHDGTVPEGSGIGPDGNPTVVAKEIQQGAISPLGGHKGYALALAVAMLCGPLTGADIGRALAGLKGGGESDARLGHFFFVLDPEKFAGVDAFRTAASAFAAELRASKPAPGSEGVRIPGERAFAARRRSLADGLEILEETWRIAEGLARELNVPFPG